MRRVTPVLLLLACFPLPAAAQNLKKETVDTVKSAIVYIQVKRQLATTQRPTTSSGTGFFISAAGHIVTAHHVVQPFVTLNHLSYPAPVVDIRVTANSGSQGQKVLKARILAVDDKNDLAILAVDAAGTAHLTLGDSATLFETTPVIVFGYPFGERFSVIQRGPEPTVTCGRVTALRHDDRNELTAVQIDASVNPGNSGGPLVDEQGRVVGVVNIMMGNSSVNFAVPTHLVNALKRDLDLTTPVAGDVPLTITSFPSRAAVYLDRRRVGETPLKSLRVAKGLHELVVLKNGFDSWMAERTVLAAEDLNVALHAHRGDRVRIGQPLDSDTPEAKEQGAGPQPFETGQSLLSETFEDAGRFETWEQSTAGGTRRTWFVADGAAHQHESDQYLHAIYLGDNTWRDYTFEADVKIEDEHDDSRAGLIFRESEDGFFLFRIHKETDKAQLAYHRKKPFGWFVLEEKPVGKDIADAWYKLRVQAAGPHLRCFLDNEPVFAAQSDLSGQGRVGLYSVESKASFDNLKVLETKPAAEPPGQTPESGGMLSFWFSDYFNLDSVWWAQHEQGSKQPAPWYFCPGGAAQLHADAKERTCEFTRYHLSDFVLDVLLSLGKGTDEARFAIVFRKHNNQIGSITFSRAEEKAWLAVSRNRNEEILQEASLPVDFFNDVSRVELVVQGDTLRCSVSGETLLRYEGNALPGTAGRIGFSTAGVPLVLHRMTVSSVQR
ncbi:MAG: trypsin-like peptidase domain-containing protein [Kiritimatiellae bacterium]|nr:trypsin-like peptidase domain-containing protein [Kiritimatiellia bacterium]